MTTAVWNEPIADPSPRTTARAAGFFWLMTFLTGIFAMFAAEGVFVRGDAAATAASILANEGMVRWGVAADMIAAASYLAATVFLYEILKPVQKSVSLLAAFFSLVGCASGAVGTLMNLTPLVLLKDAPAEQFQAVASMLFKMRGLNMHFTFAFFGLHCLLVGYLIVRSTFLPRLIGVLMLLAGIGWLTYSFANLVSPPLGRSLGAFVLFPGMIGEGALTLWLLIVGVNVERWNEQARALSWRGQS